MASPRSPHTPSAVQTKSAKPSLLPTARRPSLSTPGSSSPPTNGHPPSGFRSLRSLLPFGPKSTPSSPGASSPHPSGSRFASFSRRSMHRDRNVSASVTELPVMVIDQASRKQSVDIPIRKSISLGAAGTRDLSTSAKATSLDLGSPNNATGAQDPSWGRRNMLDTRKSLDQLPTVANNSFIRTPSPLPDLSTIIEADSSGISKHLPSASASSYSSPSGSPLPSASSDHKLVADESSALDLSTSQLDAQVMDALKAQESAASGTQNWLEIESESHQLPRAGDDSFNLSALDPDLAALLSPNRIAASDTNETLKPKDGEAMDTGNSAPSSLRAQHQSSRPRLRPAQHPSPPTTAVRRSVSGSSSTGASTQRPPPSLSMPPSPVSQPLPASSTPAPRRTQPTSMTTPQVVSRRPMLARMLQSEGWDGSSHDLRPPSVAGSRSSFDTARHRPSLDIQRRVDPDDSPDRDFSVAGSASSWNLKMRRTRRRSMSVDEKNTSPSRFASPFRDMRPGTSLSNRPEWLGPRTAKAFRAAGLLPDSDETPPSRSASRLGPPSSGTISRRRGSGSASYFGSAGSQLMESPTLTLSSRDTPRSASTAPTSVSGASWEPDELRELKDKHSLETGALLSALSDSQRTTKILRDENSELRERINKLELQLDRIEPLERENRVLHEILTELREEAGQLKLQLRLGASPRGPVSTEAFRRAHRSNESGSRLNESPRSRDGDVSEDSHYHLAVPRKRLSSSSSVFPLPPANMSLLLHEDGGTSSDFDERSALSVGIPGSPTLVFPRVSPDPPVRTHRANKSIASSVTTDPDASMFGSPRSLSLRPEHEMHLGDMDSLDLLRAGPEEDWSE
ncbi:unnamed protein product [Mycena citricolor]|uniref:Uncharacterized protein n=1 Tax=Mycena citricolor TaxID=2018698 RepID=A0AAD2Q176_9AGAR|nr:unnamed protein product [Mycena citricolor]